MHVLLAGGTVVTVTGTNFLGSDVFACMFGTAARRGTYLSTSTARCVVPGAAAGAANVRVSNNNNDYATSSVFYTYDGTCPLG
jgi:hypothetical protein